MPISMLVGIGFISAEIVGMFAGMVSTVATAEPPVVPPQFEKLFQSVLTLPFQVAARAGLIPAEIPPAYISQANIREWRPAVANSESRTKLFGDFMCVENGVWKRRQTPEKQLASELTQRSFD